MPRFSIVTPVRNSGPFIAEAVESVLSQSQADIDYIVVDAESDDETASVLEPYRDRLRWLREPDEGQADAINKGIARAKGEIIGWLNADDAYLPGALAHVDQHFEAHPECDVVYAPANMMDEDGDLMRTARRFRPFHTKELWRANIFPLSGVFFRRELVEEAGLLDTRWEYCFDYDYWLRLTAMGKRVDCLSQSLSSVRFHAGNKTLGNPSLENRVRCLREVLQMISEKHGLPHARHLVLYGETMAEQDGCDPDIDIGYDRRVLQHTLEAGKEYGHTDFGSRLRAIAEQVRKTAGTLIRKPRQATRWLPGPLGRVVNVHTRRRIFRLRHHAPRPLTWTIRAAERNTPVLPTDRTWPRISIVTPNYNCGAFLERTIRSVHEQDYPDLEHIVQDGASTDNSVAVLRECEGMLTHWASEPDKGQTNAINLGMRRASGEILAYLNSDDILMPGSLASVARFFDTHPEVDVVYGNRLLIDEQDQEIGRWVLPPHDDELLSFTDYIPQETMFWRRRAWQAVDEQLDESFQFAMDWDLILRFRDAGMRFERMPRFLGAFRITSDQKTSQLVGTTGAREMKRLRQRALGRVPTPREIRRVLSPYMWRHWMHDKSILLHELLRLDPCPQPQSTDDLAHPAA